MNTSTLIKLATVSAAVAALAACAPKPKVEPAVPTTPTVPTGPQYPTAPTGPVTGGNVGAVMPGSEQDFVVNVGDRVYFDLDSYSVRPEAQPRLDAQAAWLARYPQVTVRIEGNADERGTREYNLALGARRARAAYEYLLKLGVSPNQLQMISYGKDRPAVMGGDESSWSQNRRDEFKVIR